MWCQAKQWVFLVLPSSSIQQGGGAEIHWISSPYTPEIFLDSEWADSFYLWHCPFLSTPYNVCSFRQVVGLNEKMHVKLEQCLMENKLQLNVRSLILLLCWKYVSPPPFVQNYKLIPGLVPGTGSAPDADFKSIFYHSAFKQHYTKLYCRLFLECPDHSLTLVHSLLFYLLLCDACGSFCLFVLVQPVFGFWLIVLCSGSM